jgi:thiosulfate/3-mercaptopyruvate sulfurtransferase
MLCLLFSVHKIRGSLASLASKATNSARNLSSSRMSSTPALASARVIIDAINSGDEAAKKFKFIDGSWHMDKERRPREEFAVSRLPKAQYFDIDAVSDSTSGLPHMLPSAEAFATAVSSLGISNDDHIFVYVTKGCFSAPRVWWTFKAFNHEKVSVIDGGLEEWKRQGGPVEDEHTPVGTHNTTIFAASLNKELVVDWRQVKEIVETGSAQIIDARSAARFKAEAPEPRPGLEGGHIPGSLNLPFTTIVTADDVTKFKSLTEVRDQFRDAGVVLGSKVITSCGSGVTAAVLSMGLHMLGQSLEYVPVYDGSWFVTQLPFLNTVYVIYNTDANNHEFYLLLQYFSQHLGLSGEAD